MRRPVRSGAFASIAVSRCERSGGNGSATIGEFCGYCTEDVNLDSIPAADVVEVVRCRECEQGGKSANFPGMVYCKNTRTYTNPDDFCSRGKKEETE